eukprot:SAG31_NODE_1742_length_7385_cov_40.678836_7_plen_87_part_00
MVALGAALKITKLFDDYDLQGNRVSLHVAMTVGQFETLILGGHLGKYQYVITGAPFSELGNVLDTAASGEVMMDAKTFRYDYVIPS